MCVCGEGGELGGMSFIVYSRPQNNEAVCAGFVINFYEAYVALLYVGLGICSVSRHTSFMTWLITVHIYGVGLGREEKWEDI